MILPCCRCLDIKDWNYIPAKKNFLPYNFWPEKMPEIFVIEIFPPGFFLRLIFRV